MSTLLEYAGYRIMRLGVEKSVSEVKASFARGEDALILPEQLQCSPDFLVADLDSGECALLEVKFRRTFDNSVAPSLHERLTKQVRFWPGMLTALSARTPRAALETPDFAILSDAFEPMTLAASLRTIIS